MDEKVVKDLIDRLIDLSFAEDIGDGDHTTLSCKLPMFISYYSFLELV